jgi:hypothetical protein
VLIGILLLLITSFGNPRPTTGAGGELAFLVSNQLDTYAALLVFGSVHALKHSVEKGSLVNATQTAVKDFYALATLGLNPDGTTAVERTQVVRTPSSPVIATLVVPAKKIENA